MHGPAPEVTRADNRATGREGMRMKELQSVWVPVKNGKGEITGYLEMFQTPRGQKVTLPGRSRWIDGPEFDVSKAEI